MSLIQLKNKIRSLEEQVNHNREKLQTEKGSLLTRFKEVKESILITQILVGSFILGYLLVPAKASEHPKRRKFAGFFLFVELKHLYNQLISSLKVLKS